MTRKTTESRSLGLRREEAAQLVGLSPATMQRLIVRGEFPAPRKLCDRSVAWSRREIEAWFDSRPVSDLLPPPRGASQVVAA